jgi:hypothetical protein
MIVDKGREEKEIGEKKKDNDEAEDVIPGVRPLRLVIFDRTGTEIKVITEDDPNENLSFLESNSIHWCCHRFEVWKWKK